MRSILSHIVSAVIVFGLLASSDLLADDTILLDTLYLQNGNKIQGKVREITENKQRYWLVETPDGGIIKLRKSQVRQRLVAPKEGPEYLKRLADLPDTIEAHWEMQQWCEANHLTRQREYHLMQIIRLDPEHVDARSRLGHRARGGRWVHDDHHYQNHGYVRDKNGNYRLPASIKMAENKDDRHQSSREWGGTIRSAIRRYERQGDATALDEIRAITDPAAVEGIWDVLQTEEDVRIQRLLVETLGGIPSGYAQRRLIDIVMLDGVSRDFRELCVRLLKQPHYSQSGVVEAVAGFMDPGEDTDNAKVQTAGWLMGQMGQRSAIPYLIDGLVTTHKIGVTGGGGSITLNQGPNGSGFSTGGKAKPRRIQVENDSVLTALKLLTPEARDYGFNEEAWLNWYIGTRDVGMSMLGRDD